jgi:phage gpG-like protein
MFAIEFDGLNAASAWLDSCPAAIGGALAAKAAELAAALADRVRTDKLSGGVLNVRSGALRSSIVADVSLDANGACATIGSNGDVKYAAIQEYGGKTSAHEILPVKTQALAFVAGGALHFARKVEHPGSVIPERSYLRSTLDEMSDEIVAALADAAVESLERA